MLSASLLAWSVFALVLLGCLGGVVWEGRRDSNAVDWDVFMRDLERWRATRERAADDA